MIAIGSGDPP